MADLSPTAGTTYTGFLWDSGNGAFSDSRYRTTSGLWDKAPQLAALDPSVAFTFFDEFMAYDGTATVGDYALVTENSGAVTLSDAAGGVIAIASGATDNNEIYLSSISEVFLVLDDKPIFFEARVKLAEANTDDANFIVGLSDTVGADTLLDNGAGPAASYDGVVFCKVDGGTVFQFEASNAGTQATTANAGAFVTNTWYRLGFYIDPNDGTTALVTPYINGVAGTALNLTIAGLAEMHVLLGVKAGGGNAETLQVDYVKVVQVR